MKNFFSVFFLGIIFTNSTFAAEPTGRYKNIVEQMKTLNTKYPQFTSIFSIGDNTEGVEIYAMRVSVTPQSVDTKKIGQLVVSTHHGNESAAPVFTMHFLEELLKRYSSTDLYRGNLADQEWTVIPVLNISGYNANNRHEYGQDPNRDYPGPCIAAQGGKLKSIRRMMDFMQTRTFAGSLTVHGYAGALTYPWGVSTNNTHTHDHNAFEKITAKAAKLNGYRYGTSTDIVYPCDGAYEDYAYYKFGMWSLLLELESGSANDIRTTSEAIMAYFDQLESSPSVKNQMTGQCNRNRMPDLRNE